MRLSVRFPDRLSAILTLLILVGSPCSAEPETNPTQSESEPQIKLFTFEVRAGERVTDFCARLEKDEVTCKSFDAEARKFQASDLLPSPKKGLKRFEGVFRPGIYESPEKTAFKILEILYNRSKDRFLEETLIENPRANDNGLSVYDRMKLASIVQKEAGKSRSFAEIASVFYNRLSTNQVLGSCPTVEYSLGYHRPFLLMEDLRKDKSDYNVYLKKGLPPTPISFFTDEVWEAVNEPARTNYNFFVYDWTTSRVHFAARYEDHVKNANIARANYIRKFGLEAAHRAIPGKFYE